MQETLLIEIFTEELPTVNLNNYSIFFSKSIFNHLEKGGFLSSSSKYQTYATPRRIATIITFVKNKSPDLKQTINLVPSNIGFNQKNIPTEILLKKINSLNLDIKILKTIKKKMVGSKELLYVDINNKGILLEKKINTYFQKTMNSFPFEKTMNYQLNDGTTTVRFIRPIKNLLCIYGKKFIALNWFNVSNQNHTYGHRFLFPKKIPLSDANDYQKKLKKIGKVILSYEERKKIINNKVKKVSASLKLNAVLNDNLLNEVTSLVEYPVIYVGEFNKSFLKIPHECLILTMQKNQKYFPLVDQNKKLTNKFLIISNLKTKNFSSIVNGNEKVISPRLEDAKFFFEEDKKIKLENNYKKLDTVIFHEKLGTQYERVIRIETLAKWVGKHIGADFQSLEKAVKLCKADLLTQMVTEFPSLQGTMGKYYAKIHGEDSVISAAIEEHYFPRFSKDKIPSNELSISLALADKIDTIVGIFCANEKPTGDKDPYGLRRSAIGIIKIILERNVKINIKELILISFKLQKCKINRNTTNEVYKFILEKTKNILFEKNFSINEIQSVLSKSPNRLDSLELKLNSIKKIKNSKEILSLVNANKRITKILQKRNILDIKLNEKKLTNKYEKRFSRILKMFKSEILDLYKKDSFYEMFNKVIDLTPEIEIFFDNVLIMSDDNVEKNNRLILINELHKCMNMVADISFLKKDNE